MKHISQIITTIVTALACSGIAFAADYFVDAAQGDDGNNGRECIQIDSGVAMDAAYDGTAKSLTQSGAFDDYLAAGFRAGDVVYCSHASIDDGWYKIASATSGNAIVLAGDGLTLSGVPAGNLSNVTGIAQTGDEGPFQNISAATAVAVAGDRVFIRAGTPYTAQDGSSDAIMNIQVAGARESGILWAGWNTDHQTDLTYIHANGTKYTLAERQATRAVLGDATNGFNSVIAGSLNNTDLYMTFQNLHLIADNQASSQTFEFSGGEKNVIVLNCKLEGGNDAHRLDNDATIIGCEVEGGDSLTVDTNGYIGYTVVTGTEQGIECGSWSTVDHCISYNNTESQYRLGKSSDGAAIINCIAYGAGTDVGIDLLESAGDPPDRLILINNIIANCTVGIQTTWSASGAYHAIGVNNLFYANASNYDAEIPAGLFDITTIAPGFVDPANGDFTITSKAVGFLGFGTEFVTGIAGEQTVGAVSPHRGGYIIGG